MCTYMYFFHQIVMHVKLVKNVFSKIGYRAQEIISKYWFEDSKWTIDWKFCVFRPFKVIVIYTQVRIMISLWNVLAIYLSRIMHILLVHKSCYREKAKSKRGNATSNQLARWLHFYNSCKILKVPKYMCTCVNAHTVMLMRSRHEYSFGRVSKIVQRPEGQNMGRTWETSNLHRMHP